MTRLNSQTLQGGARRTYGGEKAEALKRFNHVVAGTSITVYKPSSHLDIAGILFI